VIYLVLLGALPGEHRRNCRDKRGGFLLRNQYPKLIWACEDAVFLEGALVFGDIMPD